MAHKKAGGSTRNGRDSESKRLGVKVYGGNFCSYQNSELFYSYRRDGITGRNASVIWLK